MTMKRQTFAAPIFFAFALLLPLWLAGCSALPDWLGEDKSDPILDGNRLKVLPGEEVLTVDPRATALSIKLPEPKENQQWWASHGAFDEHPLNIALPEQIQQIAETHISAPLGNNFFDFATFTTPPAYQLVGAVIAEGQLLVLDNRATLHALDPMTLAPKWTSELLGDDYGKRNILSGGGIRYYKGILYITVGHDMVIAATAKDGSMVWKVAVDGMISSAPAVSDDLVVVKTNDNTTFALDRNSGVPEWQQQGIIENINVQGSGSPQIDNGIVISPHSSGELYGLRSEDGRIVWSDTLVYHQVGKYTMTDILATPVIQNGIIYGVSYSGLLAATSASTGVRLWERLLPSSVTPWVAGDLAYVVHDNQQLVAALSQNGAIRFVSPLNQTIDGEKKAEDAEFITWSAPVLAGSTVWLAGSEGKLIGFNALTGTKLVSFDLASDEHYLQPIAAFNSLYILSQEGRIYRFAGR